MEKLPKALLQQMASLITTEEKNEMAIPSYLHKNPLMRWMVYSRVKGLWQWMMFHQHPGMNILDYGCGTGVLLPSASAIAEKVYGVDIVLTPAKLLIQHSNLLNVNLITPDEMLVTIEAMSMDVILCGEVLEHIQDLGSTLNQFLKLMKKTAHFLVSIPTENTLYKLGRKLAGFTGEYHLWSSSSINKKILGAGFKQNRIKKIPFWDPFAIYWLIDYTIE